MCEKSLKGSARKRIALSARLAENHTYYELREAVDIRWGQFFVECGAVPFILPVSLEEEHLAVLPMDGILFTSGNDLNRLSPNPLSERRDAFETKLLEYGIENKIPMFGVCRGFQFIASYFGAKIEKVPGHVGVKHPLIGHFSDLGEVISFHNWGVVELPDCLEERARTADGCIEAFRHRELPITALSWHPEREIPFQKDIVCSFFGF